MAEHQSFTLCPKPDILQFVEVAAEHENRFVPNCVETVLIAEKRRREAQIARGPKAE